MISLRSAILVTSLLLTSVAAVAQTAPQQSAKQMHGMSPAVDDQHAADKSDNQAYGSTTYGSSQSRGSVSPKGVIPFVENRGLYSHN